MITKVQHKSLFQILFIFLAWTFYSCKESHHSHKDDIQKYINCYNETFLTIVDTFGYYGNLIPPASSPSYNKKGFDNSKNKNDHVAKKNLIEKGKIPVIILFDSLMNFKKLNLVRALGKPIVKDTTFNKLIDELYRDSTLPNMYLSVNKISNTGKYRIANNKILNKDTLRDDIQIVGKVLLSRIIFRKSKACFYSEITNLNGSAIGKISLLKKTSNGKWEIISEILLWRS